MGQRLRFRLLSSELIESALIVVIGLALVIVMIADSFPMRWLAPREAFSRLSGGFRSCRLLREFCE